MSDLQVKDSLRTPEQYEKMFESLVRMISDLNEKLLLKTAIQSPKPIFRIRRKT
jgi:hypothetical protein